MTSPVWKRPLRAADPDPLRQRYYTVAEIARLFRVGKMTIYREIERGNLPAARIGRSLRVPADGLRAWLTARQQ